MCCVRIDLSDRSLSSFTFEMCLRSVNVVPVYCLKRNTVLLVVNKRDGARQINGDERNS